MGNYNDFSWLLSVHFVHKASKLETSSTSHLEYKPLSLTHQGREKLMIQLLFSLPSGRFSKKKICYSHHVRMKKMKISLSIRTYNEYEGIQVMFYSYGRFFYLENNPLYLLRSMEYFSW